MMSFAAGFAPASENEAALVIRDLFEARRPISIHGGRTRLGLGRQVQADAAVTTVALTGVTLYEPAEMVISARAGTSVQEIDALLAANGQMLPFEPMDHRALYGTTGEPTIGGVTACNSAGPRRIQAGAARDSLLGVRFVNGRGEVIKSGGRVMKNVTGLDLARLSCGAYGSLGVLTEVTFKVLPRPDCRATLVCEGLNDRLGVAALTTAMCSPFEVSGAAHLPAGLVGPHPQTLIRLEGIRASVEHRRKELQTLLAGRGSFEPFDEPSSAKAWLDIRDVKYFAQAADEAVWRISVKPTDGPRFIQSVQANNMRYFYDWSGGLVWLAVPASGDAAASAIRAGTARLGGHATLVRAPNALRNVVPVFEPLAEPLMKITAGIKRSVDPSRILNPAVMYAGI
jgi:glycolate oxidase FAD binding subunit